MSEKLLYLILFAAISVMLMLPSLAGFTEAAYPLPVPESGISTQNRAPDSGTEPQTAPLSGTEEVTDVVETPAAQTGESITVSVYFPAASGGGEAREMPLEDYVRGVVMAEMPASFHPEALKAQAVAARTYCVYHLSKGLPHGDTDAKICTDYAHCMAYLSDADARARWGDEAAEPIIRAASEAATGTKGEIVTCGGEAIAAVFHASSGGSTESAENVWGNAVSYLLPVTTPETPDVTTVSVPMAQWKQLLSDAGTDDYTGILFQPSDSVTVTTENDSAGRLRTLVSCGKRISGTGLRTALKLRSTLVSVAVTPESVELTVTGNGHGVGMSQYGADALADSGWDYRAILTHYYTGTEVSVLPAP